VVAQEPKAEVAERIIERRVLAQVEKVVVQEVEVEKQEQKWRHIGKHTLNDPDGCRATPGSGATSVLAGFRSSSQRSVRIAPSRRCCCWPFRDFSLMGETVPRSQASSKGQSRMTRAASTR
jgi:hypothetical protein